MISSDSDTNSTARLSGQHYNSPNGFPLNSSSSSWRKFLVETPFPDMITSFKFLTIPLNYLHKFKLSAKGFKKQFRLTGTNHMTIPAILLSVVSQKCL